MASAKCVVGADGVARWHVVYRVQVPGLPRSRWPRKSAAVGAVTAELAAVYAEEYGEKYEGRKPATVQHAADAALDLYVTSKRAAHGGISDHTERFIRQHVGAFVDFLGGKPLSAWTRRDLDAYLSTKRAAWGVNTVRTFTSTLRAFLRALRAMRPAVDVSDITDGFDIPDRVQYDGQAWSWAEVQRICEQSREDEARGFLPLAVAVHVCAYAGIDEPDFPYLDWKHVDTSSEPWVIRFPRHKTGVQRRIPVHPTLRAVLESHRATHGLVVRGIPKDYSGLYRAFVRLLKRAGISPDRRSGGWKRLRRSCLTELGKRTDLATLRDIAGHSRNSTETLKYLCSDEDRKAKAILGLA